MKKLEHENTPSLSTSVPPMVKEHKIIDKDSDRPDQKSLGEEKSYTATLEKTRLQGYIRENRLEKIRALRVAELLMFEDKEYGNVVLYAARKGSIEIIQAIINIISIGVGIEQAVKMVTSIDAFGRSALMLAAIADKPDVLEYLLDKFQFSLNYRERGYSALFYAMQENSQDAFKFLLLRGAEFSTTEEHLLARTSLEFKQYFNSPQCFLIIVQSGNINAFNFIMHHIKTQSEQNQKLFVSMTDVEGRNTLMIAAERNYSYIYTLLKSLNFDIETRDKKSHRVLYYLAQQGNINECQSLLADYKRIDIEEAKWISQQVAKFPVRTQKARENLGNILTRAMGAGQAGKIGKIVPTEISRPYRPFIRERERQLLRQVASQLYFSLRSQLDKELVEIQIMHLVVNGKHNLFIAANKFSVTSRLLGLIYDRNCLEKLLIQQYAGYDQEGNERSRRYSKKLLKRIFSREVNISKDADDKDDKAIKDYEQAFAIAHILRRGTVHHLPLNPQNASNYANMLNHILGKENNIYLITVAYNNNKNRHAEEFLVDIAEHAHTYRLGAVYSCIAGKKRPCMSCSGRMRGKITQSGSHAGRFWPHGLKYQQPEAAIRTLFLLLTENSYVTTSPKVSGLLRDYDSGSDSDEEKVSLYPSASFKLSTKDRKGKLKQLVTACEQGDEKTVTDLLEDGVALDASDEEKIHLLGAAIWGMNLEVLELLLEEIEEFPIITWEQCIQHNKSIYGVVSFTADFSARTYEEWYYLVEEIQNSNSNFLASTHLDALHECGEWEWCDDIDILSSDVGEKAFLNVDFEKEEEDEEDEEDNENLPDSILEAIEETEKRFQDFLSDIEALFITRFSKKPLVTASLISEGADSQLAQENKTESVYQEISSERKSVPQDNPPIYASSLIDLPKDNLNKLYQQYNDAYAISEKKEEKQGIQLREKRRAIKNELERAYFSSETDLVVKEIEKLQVKSSKSIIEQLELEILTEIMSDKGVKVKMTAEEKPSNFPVHTVSSASSLMDSIQNQDVTEIKERDSKMLKTGGSSQIKKNRINELSKKAEDFEKKGQTEQEEYQKILKDLEKFDIRRSMPIKSKSATDCISVEQAERLIDAEDILEEDSAKMAVILQQPALEQKIEQKLVPLFSDEKFINRADESLSKYGLKLVPGYSEGDCFYDAVMEGLPDNTHYNASRLDRIKWFREQTRQYIDKLDKSMETFSEEDAEKEQTVHWIEQSPIWKEIDTSYLKYKKNVQYAVADIDGKQVTESKIVWGEPAIDGVIICNQLKIKIHIIVVGENGSLFHRMVVSDEEAKKWPRDPMLRDLVEEKNSKNIFHVDPEKIDYSDSKIVHIANSNKKHFTPLQRISLNLHLNKISDSILPALNYPSLMETTKSSPQTACSFFFSSAGTSMSSSASMLATTTDSAPAHSTSILSTATHALIIPGGPGLLSPPQTASPSVSISSLSDTQKSSSPEGYRP